MRRLVVLSLLATQLAAFGSCGGDPWSDEIVQEGFVQDVPAGGSVDLMVRIELDAKAGTGCSRLYFTSYAVPEVSADDLALAVVIDGNVDTITFDLEAGEQIQLGDTQTAADGAGGGCYADFGVRLSSDTGGTAELTFRVEGRDGSSDPGNHPGQGAAFTIDVLAP